MHFMNLGKAKLETPLRLLIKRNYTSIVQKIAFTNVQQQPSLILLSGVDYIDQITP